MKTSNKSSLITGIVLLALSALFSISLILQLLDFGITGPGNDNILFTLGQMLYTVYGFSSILIPGFLLISGLSCFATKWTARKTMRLITALIPFFTCVVTENICRSVLAMKNSSFSILKVIITLVTGAMLVVIEYLGTGILADKINNGTFKFSKPSLPKLPKLPKREKVEEDDDEVTLEAADDPTSSVFDEALANVTPAITEKQLAEEIESTEEKADDEEAAGGKPLLTQEEFAALTTPEENELEWSNLPPAPEQLPPEYDDEYVEEEIDENDPALQFPPADEPEEEIDVSNFSDDVEEEIVFDDEPSDEYSPKFEVEFDEEFDVPNNVEESAEEEISFDNFEEETSEPIFDDDFQIEETTSPAFDEAFDSNIIDLSKTPVQAASAEEKNDPYSATRYIDSVVENPRFPHGIIIHDDNDVEEEEEQAPVEKVKPKFPTKIRLSETPEVEEEDDSDGYVEDETLPFPAFDDYSEPAINNRSFEPEVEETPAETEDSLTDYFSTVDTSATVKPVEDPYAIEVEETAVPEEEVEPAIFDQIAVQEEPVAAPAKPGFSSAAASVFSDMEAEIRKNAPKREIDVNGHAVETSTMPNLEGNSATNLTADELSDFFNAQQAENTPKTQAIQANPKPNGRAMKKGPYVIPSDLLTAYKDDQYWIIDDATKQASLNLKQTLSEFNIEAEIIGIKKGPVVTMFEILPAPGVKLSKIVALQDNIALSLAAQSVRIVAPIPGKQAVGIEVPNKNRSVVGFREIIEMDLPEWKKMAVPVILGKDILGKAQLIDLVKTPHMLIAGATGSGKSVCVNSLILSILYKRSFNDVKMILVDPKVVELKLYNNIPHLLTPVITEPKKAIQALQWCLCEMERRYALLDSMGVRDISNYNAKIKEQKICTEKLPYIVVIIDEFADLMATSGKELESIVARLTAMSRAVGIHLVLATQRPSVNVITGLIKANIPTRIAFMVASRTDSNIIIDTVGAEKLLGRGDMLFASAVDPAPIRIQGTFVSDQEAENVINAVKEYGEPDYLDEEIFTNDDDDNGARDLFGEPMDDDDPLYDQALEIVVQEGKASASYLQRRLKIGYNRAARLVEEMEERGIVGPANGSKPREVIHIP